MKRLIDDAEINKFDAVLVWKISRLSRNMLDTLIILDKFEKYDVKFISYSENFDTGSPIGRLVLHDNGFYCGNGKKYVIGKCKT
jgi:site-specific DNA recombinase